MTKRTLQEIANFFDLAVAVDEDGQTYMHKIVPYLRDFDWLNDDEVFELPYCLVADYSGDWRESLTLPDSWPKKPKFKEGEIVVSKHYFDVRPWNPATMDESRYRRPTEAEWKVLMGEE